MSLLWDPLVLGNTTLLNMIGALDKADSGQIKVAGIDLMQSEDFSKFRLNKIGFVFQLHNLIPNLTVHENVQIPLIETDVTDEEMIERAAELLNSVNLGKSVRSTSNQTLRWRKTKGSHSQGTGKSSQYHPGR